MAFVAEQTWRVADRPWVVDYQLLQHPGEGLAQEAGVATADSSFVAYSSRKHPFQESLHLHFGVTFEAAFVEVVVQQALVVVGLRQVKAILLESYLVAEAVVTYCLSYLLMRLLFFDLDLQLFQLVRVGQFLLVPVPW